MEIWCIGMAKDSVPEDKQTENLIERKKRLLNRYVILILFYAGECRRVCFKMKRRFGGNGNMVLQKDAENIMDRKYIYDILNIAKDLMKMETKTTLIVRMRKMAIEISGIHYGGRKLGEPNSDWIY